MITIRNCARCSAPIKPDDDGSTTYVVLKSGYTVCSTCHAALRESTAHLRGIRHTIEIGATATFNIAGQFESDISAAEFSKLSASEKRALCWESLQDYWDNTGIKLRDGELRIIEVAEDDGNNSIELDEVIELGS